MPLVSVIVPNYCHADYLNQRIQSILNQTFQDFELIILDDASPDNGKSISIINQYKDSPQISHIVLSQTNSGSTFKQWEKGIELAKGEWIWIAESDDYCEPSFLEDSLQRVLSCPTAVLVCSESDTIDEKGRTIGMCPLLPEGLIKGKDFIRNHMLTGNSIWNVSATLFKKEASLRITNEYTHFHAAGDYLFYCQLAELGDVVFVPSVLNHFRQHTNKVTFGNSTNGTEDREVLRIIQYLDAHHYFASPKEKGRAMRHFLRRIFGWGYPSESLRKELIASYLNESPYSLIYYRFDYFLYRVKRHFTK